MGWALHFKRVVIEGYGEVDFCVALNREGVELGCFVMKPAPLELKSSWLEKYFERTEPADNSKLKIALGLVQRAKDVGILAETVVADAWFMVPWFMAAILNIKMERLTDWNAQRRKWASRYDQLLSEIESIVTPIIRPGATSVYHLYVIRTPRRDALQQALKQAGIPTAINYPQALPFYQAYNYLGHDPEDFPVAYRHAGEILSLPIHPHLEFSDQDLVVQTITQFVQSG